MLVDRLIYGVAQFDASAFTADRIQVSPSGDARTLSERLRVVNRAALERGFPGALPTFDDDESAGTIGGGVFSACRRRIAERSRAFAEELTQTDASSFAGRVQVVSAPLAASRTAAVSTALMRSHRCRCDCPLASRERAN